MQQAIGTYVLAGGLSSRMGRDKAMLQLGGKTLLARAVETLKSVPALRTGDCEPLVTIVGDRTLLEGADRAIVDRYPGCGPLGGMEAALNDLLRTGGDRFAFFIPVDMPFLATQLIQSLLEEWMEASQRGARVCYAVVDGVPQPLVSLLHSSLHPGLVTALANRQFKVTAVLETACNELASSDAADIRSGHCAVWKTVFTKNGPSAARLDRGTGDDRVRDLWFTNVNTEAEFSHAETFLMRKG